MTVQQHLIASYRDALTMLTDFISKEDNMSMTAACSEAMAALFQNGNKILICGNGGSSCDAMHFAEEFTGRYRKNRKALPVISLTDPAHITCVANDFGYDQIFFRGVDAFGKPGDMLVGISTSGNSPNVVNAVNLAKEKGMTVLLLLGKDGGVLKGQGDYEFHIPGDTSDRIQEIHMTILHVIIEGVERILFPQNY